MENPLSRRKFLQTGIALCVGLTIHTATVIASPQSETNTGALSMQHIQDWDKTFPRSNKVDHQKVNFKNRYGITLTGDLYTPKNVDNQNLPQLF
ncbi:hypothetical protein RHO15_03480 [Utexia brackfieldae]